MDEVTSPPSEISLLLAGWRQGSREARERLFALVYDELRRRAHRQLQRHKPAPLSTGTLVHETFLKLVDRSQARWVDRTHFFAVASLAMRHILVDCARKRLRQKRGGGLQPELLDEGTIHLDERAAELEALDSALNRLKALDERLSKVVELRFFGGLTFEEAAEVLEISPRTIRRDWRKARAFLYQAMAPGTPA
jgi:RNA polymerase sigma factor (TIGR02999 family)